MSIDEKALAKVQKLLNVANGTAEGGEHERDTAMRMALKILAAHNLSMSDVSVGKDHKKEDRVKVKQEFRDDGWAGIVANAIAKLYFCKVFKSPGQNNKMNIHFIGLESNVATAREMAMYAIQSIAKESRKYPSKASFRAGATNRLCDRCASLRAEAEKEDQFSADAPRLDNTPVQAASTGTALVLASLYQTEAKANELMLAEMGVTLNKARKSTSRSSDGESYYAGQAYGGRMGLNKQIK